MAYRRPESEEKAERPFSLWLFVVTVVLSLAFAIFVLWLVAPKVWRAQTEASWLSLIVVFLSAHFVNAFMEYFFHRYVLHCRLIPGLGYFYKAHTRHHSLTRVISRKTSSPAVVGVPGAVIENVYPILEEKQHESSFFPWYSCLVFLCIGCVVLIPLQLLLPSAPILLGGFVSVAWSLFLYEILHAIEHWSLEKWRPFLDSQRFGWFWKKVYGFHLRHHADIRSNESISGFFGIPVPDFLFGTWVDPTSLYAHGEPTSQKDSFTSPRPAWLIRWLDDVAKEIQKKRMAG